MGRRSKIMGLTFMRLRPHAMLVFCAALITSHTVRADGSLSFITLGDWGGAALEEPTKPYSKNVQDVATAMATSAQKNNVKFIVNTGDNFYWCGIQNVSDFQIEK